MGGRLLPSRLRRGMLSNCWIGSSFQIHLLKLSDGRPHPLAPADPTVFHIDFEEGRTITRLVVLISKHRLVVVVTWIDHSDIFTWDWRSRRKLPVSLLESSG